MVKVAASAKAFAGRWRIVAMDEWDNDVLAIGEVALSGDIRPVPFLSQRVAEAARLGFTRALVPRGTAASSSAERMRCATEARSSITSRLPAAPIARSSCSRRSMCFT